MFDCAKFLPRTVDAAQVEFENLNSIASEMKIGRSDFIARILREWLETNTYLPVHELDDDSETDGSA